MELFLLCATAFCICLLFHAIVSVISTELINRHFNNDQNIVAMKQKNVDSLQEFVDENEITLDNLDQINLWSSNRYNVLLKIYANGYLIYDSIYGVTNNTALAQETVNDYSNMDLYPLNLKDTTVNVNLLCFDYTLQNNVSTIISVISVLLFFYIIIMGVQKKIKYLVQLHDELNLLAEDLNHEISIKGCDEITQVATGIDELRKSVIDKMDNEKRAYDANIQLITTLSHDIKTPLTSIIAFIELARDRAKELHDQALSSYLDLTYEKSFHLNNLINELFSHFLLHSNSYQVQFETLDTDILIMQILEENLYELETNGATIERDVQNISSKIQVNLTLFHRLFNNIFSNIHKYANFNEPIYVQYYLKDAELIIKIKNSKKSEKDIHQSSTKIGLNNCKAIMEKHNGEFMTTEDDHLFTVELHFPVSMK